MKKRVTILALNALFASGLVWADDMKVNLVGYHDCSAVLDGLGTDTPQKCFGTKQRMTLNFMVEGQNIASVDEESLKVSVLQANGKDAMVNRRGDDAFSLGSTKVDDDGEYALFDVKLDQVPFGSFGEVSLDATVGLVTSEGFSTEVKKDVDLTKPFLFKVGDLSLSNQDPKKFGSEADTRNTEGAVQKALADAMVTALFGGSDDELKLYVFGDIAAFIALEVLDNGKPLEQGWTSTSDSGMGINFAIPSGTTVDISIRYWYGLKRVTVPVRLESRS
ncbi:MAG: hypothetical protein AAGI44_13520 [Pseudomonadota bacterium]